METDPEQGTQIDWYRNTPTDDLFDIVVMQIDDTIDALRVLYGRLRDEGVSKDKKVMLQIRNSANVLKTARGILRKE